MTFEEEDAMTLQKLLNEAGETPDAIRQLSYEHRLMRYDRWVYENPQISQGE